jgi:prepilin-type processing-associated H-X9-DG protein
MADALYVSDFDGSYPETKDPSRDPASDDADGSQDEPDYGSAFTLIEPYVSKTSTLSRDRLFACPSSLDPFGATCIQINPDVPDLTSYLVNGYFIFGLNESYIGHPSLTILFAERRSEGDGDAGPFCNYTYYPWFNPANKEAPEDDMDPLLGAVATERHLGHSNYGFPDGHVKSMAWSQTYSPPELNLHLVTAS